MMTKFSMMLIAVLIITISQTSAQFTKIFTPARAIPPIQPSLPSKTVLSTEAILPTEVISSIELPLSPESTLSPEATLSPEVTPLPEATLSPEVILLPGATLSPEVTLLPEATLSPEVTLPTEATLSSESTSSITATSSIAATPSIAATSSIPVTPSTEPRPNIGRCLTPVGKDGSCISLHQCASIFNLIRKKPLLEEDKLYLKSSQCGYRNRMVLVCCPDQQQNVAAALTPMDSGKLALLPKRGECGKMTTNRLYGGYTTEFDAFTWSALLEYSKGGNRTGHHCGGTLINDRYILTAAHCVIGIPKTWSLTRVRLGEWDTGTDNECKKFENLDYEDCPDPHIDVPIERIIPHENFVPTSINALNDIALIRLSNSIISTDFIQPICLPLGENMRQAFHEQSLDLVGWGVGPQGYWNTIKQRTSASVIPLGYCREKYANYRIELQDSQFCVEGQLKNDTCRIDSGGAAVSFDTSNKGLGSFFIAGIQSFGPCWREGYPGVYTRVSEYLNWIIKNIQP